MKIDKKGSLAITEILLLIIGIFAISWVVGSSIPSVSAQSDQYIGQCASAGGSDWQFQGGDSWTCYDGQCEISGPSNVDTSRLCNFGISCTNSNTDVAVSELSSCDPASSESEGGGSGVTGALTTGAAGVAGKEVANVGKEAISSLVNPSSLPEPVVELADSLGIGSPSLIDGGSTAGTVSGAGTGGSGGAEGAGIITKVKSFLGTEIGTSTLGAIIIDAGIATAIYLWGDDLLVAAGVPQNVASSISKGAAAAWATTNVAIPIFNWATGAAIAGPLGWGIGLGVGIIVGIFSYKDTKYKVVSFQCQPWSPPTGGEYCQECNDNEFGCSEYQCRSLGAGCELVNKGTQEELCTWVNRNDVEPPVIQPLESVLSPDYEYTPNNAISPPDRGVIIEKISGENACIEAFFPLQFGITLDEPAKCKIDPLRKDSYESMSQFFSQSSTYKYNHTQRLSVPSPSSLASQNITIANGDDLNFHVRCEDRNGNSNTATFSFNFCVDEGPDTTPPLIESTSIRSGQPIAFNQSSLDLQVLINEPSECRWSRNDIDYDSMENQMSCETNPVNQNSQNTYTCTTELDGLKNDVENNFYFRCEDQPWLEGTENEADRNKNAESYEYTLIGTRPLVISSLSPDNQTISDSTNTIRVTLEAETSAGYKEGESICYFSNTGEEGSYIEYFETNSFEHSQDLYLSEGDYTYYTRCVDLGGNTDTGQVSFSVDSDTSAPITVRAYREADTLKIITNEPASCVYSHFRCDYLFEDGTPMDNAEGEFSSEHSTEWDPNRNFHIKCEDEFGNRPAPNQCNIIVRPFEVS